MSTEDSRNEPPPREPSEKHFDEAQRGQLIIPEGVAPTAAPDSQSGQQVEIEAPSEE